VRRRGQRPHTARKPSARSRPLSRISSVAPQAPLPRIGPAQRRASGPRPFIPPGPPPQPRASPTDCGARPSLVPRSGLRLFAGRFAPRSPFGDSPSGRVSRLAPRASASRPRCSPARFARRFAIPRLSLRSSLAPLGTLGGTRHVVGGSSCAVRGLPSLCRSEPSQPSAVSVPWRNERATLARVRLSGPYPRERSLRSDRGYPAERALRGRAKRGHVLRERRTE